MDSPTWVCYTRSAWGTFTSRDSSQRISTGSLVGFDDGHYDVHGAGNRPIPIQIRFSYRLADVGLSHSSAASTAR
jgi:hypothetical protein